MVQLIIVVMEGHLVVVEQQVVAVEVLMEQRVCLKYTLDQVVE